MAVKVLWPEVWSRSTTERFLREIRIVSSLEHPNILPLLESGSVDELPYFVMPFVAGESLQSCLDREGPLAVEDAVDVALDVADGLDHAHGNGIIHRDIKPDNILLSGGRAIVADFGVARLSRSGGSAYRTTIGGTVGTPAYMSPEQACSEDVDSRSDIYSLGCVLYEALTGEPPFTGRTVQAVVARHMYQAPPPVTVVRPSVPRAIAAVIEKALQKTPADRFKTAKDFAWDLRHGRDSQLGGARTPASREPPRLRVAFAAGASLLLAGVGLRALLPKASREWRFL